MEGEEDAKKRLALLREPFPANQIGKLAKGSKAQMTCKAEEKKNCNICGGWHHPKLIHLDYVGHAALTDRLLDVDPFWSWYPLALTEKGLPAFDESGGLWIKLTVCGHSRIGYGHAEESQYKEVGSREKEVIGDALRNAAMRFGAALELWHKGELHTADDNGEEKINQQEYYAELAAEVDKNTSAKAMAKWFSDNQDRIAKLDGQGKEKLRRLYKQYADIFKQEAQRAQ